jgi:CubicO group peptidase (beta-lactamase class C family)
MNYPRQAAFCVLLGAGLLPAAPATVFPGAEWEQSSPAAQGVDPEQLQRAIRYLEEHSGRDGVSQLFLVRNGRAIWSGPKVDAVHGVWSMTKSFTSTVLGLLIDDRKTTLDTLASRHLPSLAERYPAVTLRHFSTMTSGYRAARDEPQGSYRHGPSPTPFVPADPLFAPPGSTYCYWDSAMNQFANVLTRIAGEPLDALFERRMARPIGMDPSGWRWGDFGVVDVIKVNGGAGNHDRFVRISARQAARFGLLFLQRGAWNGRRLLSERWVALATSPQVTVPTLPASPAQGTGLYGLNWWCNGKGPDGRRKWPGVPARAFAAVGHNNNYLFVIPEWNMVVARLGLDQADRVIAPETWDEFFRQIGQALGKASPKTE